MTIFDSYRCPISGSKLFLKKEGKGSNDSNKILFSQNKNYKYKIIKDIPHFVTKEDLQDSDVEALKYYEKEASIYDEYLPLTFATFEVNEVEIRNQLIELLKIKKSDRILEIGCGTGRDTELIAKKLGSDGTLFAQDLSPSMLNLAVSRLANTNKETHFSVANASYLPFPDNFFDSIYHFGGLNTFSDIPRTFSEISRVTKTGGRVVIGDESMPLWLRGTEFGEILMNSNPHYKFKIPFEHLPVTARDVCLRWIIGNVFYAFDFTIGDGPPTANFDFKIPGKRGGTHRSRYFGNLEGVELSTKKLAYQAQLKSGKSMSKWLTDVVKSAADHELQKEK